MDKKGNRERLEEICLLDISRDGTGTKCFWKRLLMNRGEPWFLCVGEPPGREKRRTIGTTDVHRLRGEGTATMGVWFFYARACRIHQVAYRHTFCTRLDAGRLPIRMHLFPHPCCQEICGHETDDVLRLPIRIKRSVVANKIRFYQEGKVNLPSLIRGSSGLVEIVMKEGSASGRLGVQPETSFRIEWR